MSIGNFRKNLDTLETEVSNYFFELLNQQEEIIIFSEEDLEHDTPDDYLEMRNDIMGNVFDVHLLKVSKDGILCIEADGSNVRHLAKLSDFSSIEDKINLLELMEINLD
jgi:hypothetical protein